MDKIDNIKTTFKSLWLSVLPVEHLVTISNKG